MKIIIKKEAVKNYMKQYNLPQYRNAKLNWGNIRKWRRILQSIAGTEIEVETEFLFKNQFNTVPIPGVSEQGLRVMECDVLKVIDDERPGKAKCRWCGHTSKNLTVCEKCGKDEYLEIF